jgi:hypothetical protein
VPGRFEDADITGMPHNKTTLPFADLSDRDRVAAVFTYKRFKVIEHPAFAHEVPVIGRGRPAQYPPLLQFLILVLARVYGSQRAAIIALNRDDLWAECCDWYRALVKKDINLPSAPPTGANQDAYVHRYFGVPVTKEVDGELRKDWLPNEAALALLRSEFTTVALAQAHAQGNIPNDTSGPDFANPDERFTFFGDGTWLEPYSKATREKDPTGKWRVVNSRAKKGRHRIPDVCRRGKIDGKNVVGINNIFIGMWTPAGRIVVSADQTINGESVKALEMIRDLIARLGGRVHFVVWDKALSGHALHELAARFRVLVLTRFVKRSSRSPRSDGYTARDLMSKDEALALVERGGCLPLGTSVTTDHGERKPVRSKFHRLRHPTPELEECDRHHQLWVDGDVLWDTYQDPADLGIYKSQAARSVSAIPRPVASLLTDADPVWEVPIVWELRCASAPGGTHRFTTLWEPLHLAGGRPVDGPQKAMHDLRPLGAEDERFWKAHGVRNNAESLNSLYKKMFNNSEHAMRQRGHEQLVDQIAASFAMNAVTWLTHQRKQADNEARSTSVHGVLR